MSNSVVYHINIKSRNASKRTTISIDARIAEYFEIWLGYAPGSEEGRSYARQWLQEVYDNEAAGQTEDSRWFRNRILSEIVDRKIHSKWVSVQ